MSEVTEKVEAIVIDTEAGRKNGRAGDADIIYEVEMPKIKWSKFSVKQANELGQDFQHKAKRLNVLIKLLDNDKLPDAYVEELLELSEMNLDRAANDAMFELFARVVEFLPRSWFVDAAPKNLDFGKAQTYGYLQGYKVKELAEYIRKGPGQGN